MSNLVPSKELANTSSEVIATRRAKKNSVKSSWQKQGRTPDFKPATISRPKCMTHESHGHSRGKIPPGLARERERESTAVQRPMHEGKTIGFK